MRLRFAFLYLVLFCWAALSNAQAKGEKRPSTEIKTAGIKLIPIQTPKGTFKVWTKKVGSGKIKVLLLHGGPGATHEYFESFEDFLPKAGIEFYYYDQLGSFYSDQPTDTTLWQMDRFVDEVEQVRRGLDLNQFYLLGSSWGSMLAMEYTPIFQKYLKGLVLCDMTASISSYMKYVTQLKSQMPDSIQKKLDAYEEKQDYNNPDYQSLVVQYLYNEHVCRVLPWPDPVARTFKNFNQQVYNVMQGPNEFVITGNFKDWGAWDKLPRIKVPTLCIGAKYDEMNPDDIRREGELIPNSRVYICPNGSHLCMWDDQQNYFRELIRFLKEVDSGSFRPDKKK